MNWVPILALLAIAAPPCGSAVAAPATSAAHVHVLADRIGPGEGGDGRRLTIVVEDAGTCVAAARVEVIPPFVGAAVGTCALALTGPAASVPEVEVAGARLRLPAAPTAGPDRPAPPPAAPTAGATWVVAPTVALAVGQVATAAELWVLVDGEPSSDVELNVRAEGARVRALRWRRPGLGAIEVLVPTWTPTIELVIQDRGGRETRTTLAVDPGPPVVATVTASAAQAGRPFAVEVAVATEGGAPFTGRHRLTAAGCVANDHHVACPRSGPVTVVVSVAHDDRWIPIGDARVDVGAAPPPPPPPRPRPPAPGQQLGWEVAARGATASDGLRSAGLIAGAVRRLGPHVDATLGLGWQFGSARLAPVAPVKDALTVSEHHLELRGGVVARLTRDAPWSLRVAAGPVLVRQRGAMTDGGWRCTGARAQALAALGVRLALGSRAVTIEVGARVAAEVRALDWPRPDRQAYLEVGLASER